MLVIVGSSSFLFNVGIISFLLVFVTSRPITEIQQKEKTNLDKLFEILNITDNYESFDVVGGPEKENNVTLEKEKPKVSELILLHSK